MKNSRIITIAAIAFFCVQMILLAIWDDVILPLLHFVSLPALLFVVVGGGMLAFAKIPRGINNFFRYFSKTALLSGAMASVFQLSVLILNWETYTVFLGAKLSQALISMFYGLLFSAISYALHKE